MAGRTGGTQYNSQTKKSTYEEWGLRGRLSEDVFNEWQANSQKISMVSGQTHPDFIQPTTSNTEGKLVIDVAGLDSDLKRYIDIRTKVDTTLQSIIQKVNRVAEADNWPRIQEGSVEAVRILEIHKNNLEEKENNIKKYINEVIEQVGSTENRIENKFNELLDQYKTEDEQTPAEDKKDTEEKIETLEVESQPAEDRPKIVEIAEAIRDIFAEKIETIKYVFSNIGKGIPDGRAANSGGMISVLANASRTNSSAYKLFK